VKKPPFNWQEKTWKSQQPLLERFRVRVKGSGRLPEGIFSSTEFKKWQSRVQTFCEIEKPRAVLPEVENQREAGEATLR